MTPMSESDALLEGVTLSQSTDVLRVTSSAPLRVLACANLGDDLALTRNIVAMSVARAQGASDLEQKLNNWAIQAGIHEPYVGLLTSAPSEDLIVVLETTAKWKVAVLFLADLLTLCCAGKTGPKAEDAVSGIDIIVLTDASLSMGAMVSAMVTATEAKVRALVENGIATRDGDVATGAPADSLVIGCLSKGERIRRAGPTTLFGHTVGKAVYQSLSRALQSQQVV